jgi:Homeodomain-like domain
MANFWRTWPTRDRSSIKGYVYVIEYSTGAVKVGSTRDPRGRIQNLEWTAAQFGVTVARGWLSDGDEDYREREQDLIAVASGLGQRLAAETFRAPYLKVVTAAQGRVRTWVPTAPTQSPVFLRREHRRAEVIRMFQEGYSYREIAAEIGCSAGTIHSDLKPFRESLTNKSAAAD